jgi:D-alanyl-D-alanine carboxypeptidase
MSLVFAAVFAALITTVQHIGAGASPPHTVAPRISFQKAAQLQRALDAGRDATGAPGVSAAVMVDGWLVWFGESGTADTSVKFGNAPITDDTVFPLASVSKMFVATIAMRLVEEGKLRLDEPIAKFVPTYLSDSSRVTVLELLGHTSGYRDDEDDPVILKWLDDPNHSWTRDQLERREGPPRFTPGSRFSYCNSCYVMLGGVIEKASGATIGAELNRFVVDPLHLRAEVDIDRDADWPAGFARGYDLRKGKLVDTFAGARDLGVPTYDWGPVWTDGGIAANAIGVARFTDALFGGSIVGPKSLATMLAPGGKNEILESDKHDGRLWRGHSGFYDGFTAEAWYDRGRRVTIVVLTNRTDDNDPATQVWNRLATAYDRIRP